MLVRLSGRPEHFHSLSEWSKSGWTPLTNGLQTHAIDEPAIKVRSTHNAGLSDERFALGLRMALAFGIGLALYFSVQCAGERSLISQEPCVERSDGNATGSWEGR